jgi:site-specific DNA-cytosine methylase
MKDLKLLRIGTLFSGSSAFEQALFQLGIPHQSVFACDNGERYITGKNTGKFLSKTFIDLFADCGDLSPGIEHADGIRTSIEKRL